MKSALLRIAALALLVLGVVFFWRAIEAVAQKEYVGSALVVVMGLATLQAATELVRVAFVERDR